MAHDSAQPCGCDPGANWLCEDHRLIRDTITATLDELENAAPRPPLMAPSLGACPTCDGYAINASEAPYCPSCARERETQAAAYKLAKERDTVGPIRETWTPERPQIAVLRERRQAELDKALETLTADQQRKAETFYTPDQWSKTRYMLRLKLKVTGDVSEHSFDSMTARNLFVFTLGPWADVQEEWTA